ncbi:MAG TPA: 50S ribosomal protein L13 [Candidatus Nanoarchaeia archaeon]|uniref:50S ribosomal protein L13 n=1 Tax=uncultured archaeon Rifle_16ft_4_minimus_37913 TaxID=1665152 RepID=A0A0H4T6E2_9ARCH|nr:ribosomal protein L13, archaeal/eukaryotic [uncultured archaeon Rifle_16ft_4_minimus_37913]HKZ33948.1 50S ribosomal protein L13 [Candidatus Nanoarchaeia archaeon]
MKIINGENAVLGRLASYAAKQALLGEEIVILNCEKVMITGSRQDIREKFEAKRRRIGSGQKGPKHSRLAHLIVKRAIRGMLSHRSGRGKEAFRRIKCFSGVPEEFKDAKKIVGSKEKKAKFMHIEEITKQNKQQ